MNLTLYSAMFKDIFMPLFAEFYGHRLSETQNY